MTPPLTQMQRDAIRAMLSSVGSTGRLPTVRALGEAVGTRSCGTAHRLAKGLRDRGIVTPGPPVTFAAACFKGFRFDPESGLERVF